MGLLYLLARVADTIADTGENPSLLLTSLNEYQEACVQGSDDIDLTKLASLQSDPDESDLLIDVTKVIGAFQGIESNDRDIMLGCLLTIISGQRLDIERFGTKESAIVSSGMMPNWTTTRTGLLGPWESFGQKFRLTTIFSTQRTPRSY